MDSIETCNEIADNYTKILNNAASAAIKAGRDINDIKIIAVSKTHPAKIIECAYKNGLRLFGENYVQEFTDKHDILSDKGLNDIEWHFIGHLQSNKVRNIAPFVNMIHSVDSLKLAEEINKKAALNNRNIDILIQMNTSGEYSKSGCEPEKIVDLAEEISYLDNVRIQGLMTIGTFTDDEKIQRKEFSLLRHALNIVNEELGQNWKELSMGMTGDYEVAIDEGATMIRVGTAIFGSRSYKNFG